MVRKNKNYLGLIFVLMICLIVLLSFNLKIFIDRPLSVEIIDMNVIVGEKIGMVINDSILDYGVLPRGVSINKKVLLKNEYDFPVIVDVNVVGLINNFVYGESEFILAVDESKEYNIDLIVSENMEFGEYEGKLIFEFRRKN